MTDAAAFQAAFSNFKLVPGRKVAQLIFEVPIEQADHALKMLGGVPQFGSEQWAGIARLSTPKAASETSVASKDAKARYDAASEGEKAKTRAAILCTEATFQAFLYEKYPKETAACRDVCFTAESTAATILCDHLDIDSRREIATNPDALAAFLSLESEYREWARYGGRNV